MKQIPMTPELEAKIKAIVGPDTDTSGLSVFETIAINTKPLPGKRGTIFEKAVVTPLTLQQMSDSINSGNSLPLIQDHMMMGTPVGRVFEAGVFNTNDGHQELRVLFYLDGTEQTLTQKVNAGSLDEVSVSFLASQMLCSECTFDYFGAESTIENIYTLTCSNGHTIGQDGVHVRLVGLNQFTELSLVTRGAADNAKIVGKSESKLQPATRLRLAARGFEVDGLVCRASKGEDEVSFDPNKLMTDLVAAQAQVLNLTAAATAGATELAAANSARDEALGRLDALNTELASVKSELEAAKALPNNEADYQAALTFIGEVYKNILTASGAEVPAELPKTVAELSAAITEKTNGLTAILPVGGVTTSLQTENSQAKPIINSAFSNRRFDK